MILRHRIRCWLSCFKLRDETRGRTFKPLNPQIIRLRIQILIKYISSNFSHLLTYKFRFRKRYSLGSEDFFSTIWTNIIKLNSQQNIKLIIAGKNYIHFAVIIFLQCSDLIHIWRLKRVNNFKFVTKPQNTEGMATIK